jgi:hypothetical protein
MNEFVFPTDDKGLAFCREIALEMRSLFEISEEEAIGRINRQWKHTEITGDKNIVYHEDSTSWAKDIYYGHDSAWWKGENGLRPRPYPS